MLIALHIGLRDSVFTFAVQPFSWLQGHIEDLVRCNRGNYQRTLENI